MIYGDSIKRFVYRFSPQRLKVALEEGVITGNDLPEILCQAVFMRKLDVVDALVDSGFVGINMRNRNGFAPLEVAIETLDRKTISHVLSMGALINGIGANGLTPLHAAIDTEVEAALYEGDRGGADVEPSLTITALLLERGADKEAKNAQGETPVEFASRRGHRTAAAILR